MSDYESNSALLAALDGIHEIYRQDARAMGGDPDAAFSLEGAAALQIRRLLKRAEDSKDVHERLDAAHALIVRLMCDDGPQSSQIAEQREWFLGLPLSERDALDEAMPDWVETVESLKIDDREGVRDEAT